MPDVAQLQARVTADTSQAESALRGLGQQINTFGDSFKQGLGIGAGISAFTTGLHALAAGFGALKSGAIDFNQTLDTARASMGKYFQDQKALNASIDDLNTLAAKTPFAFEGLLIAQQRTIGAARSAQELRDNMDAISVVAANTGRVSTENMGKISLALGQVQSKGHLAGGELLQLTEAGVKTDELFKILAAQFGTTTGAIQKMVSDGKISSQDLFAAMRTYAQDPRNRAALDELAKTWEGSWSTIADVGKKAVADTFRPLFDAITGLAYGFGQFLQSSQFQAWAEALRLGFAGAVEGAKGFLTSLAPLGDALKTAFGQATSGDFSGAFSTLGEGIRTALGGAMTTIAEFSQGMFGAGAGLIGELARGIYEGGAGVIGAAVNGIAEIIASFLIGSSPPPAGPLADIDKGGAAVGAAWVGGFGGVMLKGTEDVVAGIKDRIAGLKDASRDLAEQIRGIAEEMAGVDHAIRGVRERIEDAKAGFAETKRIVQEQAEATKAGYADAIAGVRDQIQTIKDAHEQATRGVQDQIESIKDRYTALLDGVRDQIQAVKDGFADQARATQDQIEAVKDRYAGMLDGVRDRIARIKDAQTDQLDPLERQLEKLRDASKEMRAQYDSQQAILRSRTQQLMLDALGDPAQRAQLQGQLATLNVQQDQLDLQQQIADAQEKLADAKTTPEEAASLRLKLQQLAIQKQLADMIDETALGEATRQQALQESEGQQISNARAIEDAHNRIAAIPIEQKIADIKREGEDALRPLTARMAELERGQQQALEPLTDRLREIKHEESDALKPLEARLKGLQREQRDALEPLQDRLVAIKREEQDALKPLEGQLKDIQRESDVWGRIFAAELAAIDQQQRETLKPLDDQLRNLTRQKETLSEHRAELERQKQIIAEQIGLLNEQAAAAKAAAKATASAGGTPEGAPAGGLAYALSPDTQAAIDGAKKAGATLATRISEGFTGWWNEHKATIVESVLGAFAGGLLFGPLGAIAGAAFLPRFIETLQQKLAERGFDAQVIVDAIQRSAASSNYDDLAEQIARGITRGLLRLPGIVGGEIGKTIASWFKPSEDDQRSVGRAIVDGIFKEVGIWWDAYVADFQTRVEKFRAVLDTYATMIANALRSVFGYGPVESGPISGSAPETVAVGKGINEGLEEGIKNDEGVVGACYALGGKIIDAFKWVFGIASPSTVMQAIGEDLLSGLQGGIQGFWDATLGDWLRGAGKWIIDAFGTYVGGPAKWLWQAGVDTLQGWKDGVQHWWDTDVSGWLKGAGDWIVTAFGDYVGGPVKWLWDAGGDVLQGLKDGVQAAWDGGQVSLGKWLGGAGDWVIAAVNSFGDGPGTWLVKAGQDALQSFYDGINELWGSEDNPATVKGLLKTITDWIPDWIKKALGVHSPSQVMYGIGHNVMDGLIHGLRDKFPDLQTTMKKAMAAISGMSLSGLFGDFEIPDGDVAAYIIEAAIKRAIDPLVALRVAGTEGGTSEWNRVGDFVNNPPYTGMSYGPFQLHYAGGSDPQAGMGDAFTKATGKFATEDPKGAIDYALDQAAKYGWGQWYGAAKAGIGDFEGITGGYALGGILPADMTAFGRDGGVYRLHSGEGVFNAEQMAHLAPIMSGASGGSTAAGPIQTHRIEIVLDGRTKEEIYIVGRDLAIRRGRVSPGGTL